ncbi:cyclic diguanylate phosphodiesterase [Aeromonas hydrophila]|uniref:cyclic diguanylate phosphodiesterase n=1 Tax=Aeromonas hydrophila TaxID=644 RepID=UPI00214D5DE1|nr:cyclic diguanylate phosphodiesterase [Aeromonas hydrophila]MCR3909682.1 cyclic diguanylate phosphodiesterase [Aeromonas hydrophila]
MSMSLPNLDFSRPWLRLGCTLLLFSLPFTFGGWAIYNSHMHALDRQSEHSARQAVTLMETMLAHAESANRSLFPFIDQPCEQALFTLRQQVALVPFVRTVNLVGENGIYCNSLFGAIQWPDRLERYSGGRLRLLAGNQVRAHHPLLALRDGHGKGAAFSTIDGEYLRFMLVLSGRPCTLLLHVGQQWLDERGVLSEGGQPQAMLASHEIHSSRYPLSIYAGHEVPSFWNSLWQARRWAILLLLGISLGFALLIWWLLGRPRSPEVELARALRNREFVPYLQPLVAAGSERVMGAEVLMRWQHPTAGLIRPDLFIPQAEASGLIVPMTSLLMEEVARELSLDRSRVPHGFHISFNISAAHCRDMALLAECRRFLDHFAPGQVVLVLELTERELLVADPQTLALFRQLDEMGVRLAMDDFGTGHSSLHYLQQFHVDYLKIDQSFIGRIGTESLSEHIVDNVIDLGARLGLALVAEGVETRQQADYLKRKGVDYLQGYLFGRPLPLRDFQAALGQPQVDRTAQLASA